MPTSLTTAQLNLPNDSLGRGVVALWPLEEAVGATAATDVATSANASVRMNWQGVWSSSNSYQPRDLVVLSSVGTSQVAYWCTGPIPSGGLTPSTDTYNWVKLWSTAYVYRGIAATPLTAAVNDAYIDPSNGLVYRCTVAVSSSSSLPNADAAHWAIINTALSIGGKVLTVGGTGSVISAGNTPVASGAAGSWGATSKNPVTATFGRAPTQGELLYGLGNAASMFCVVNLTNASLANLGMIGYSGNVSLRTVTSGNIFAGLNANYGSSLSYATTLSSSEVIPAGTHTVEIQFDGSASRLIIDGSLASYYFGGANGFNNSLAATYTGIMTGLLSHGTFGGAICTVNNFMIMNRCLTRAEHIGLMQAAGLTFDTTRLPMRNRGQDAYNSAIAANATLKGRCAYCGGTLANNETRVTVDINIYHPGCDSSLAKYPLNSISSYSDVAQSAVGCMMSYAEVYGTGPQQYHDGTRFKALADGWGGGLTTTQWRGAITGGTGIALAARAGRFAPNHWMWGMARSEMETAFNLMVGSDAGRFGLAPLYNATGVTAAYNIPGQGALGWINPGFKINGQYQTNDGGGSCFLVGNMAMAALAFRPYLEKYEPATWERWVAGIEAGAWFNNTGTTTANSTAQGYDYWVNGNWQVNKLLSLYGAYRVTGSQAWLNRYRRCMAHCINPFSKARSASGSLITTLVPPNALGNYTRRGFWSPGKNYAVGDMTAIILGDTQSTGLANWRGDWDQAQTYALNDVVFDRAGGTDYTFYRLKTSSVVSSTPPHNDTTNWTLDYPDNIKVYLTQNAVTNSQTRPDLDTTGSFLLVSDNNHVYNSGFTGLVGTAGNDTANWTDYKVTFTEWGASYYSGYGIPGELNGLPGYDTGYHMYQVQILACLMLMMGNANGPNAFTDQADYQQVKRILNAMVNQALQFENASGTGLYTIGVPSHAAPTYNSRKTTVSSWSSGGLAMVMQLGRSDLTSTYKVGDDFLACNATFTGQFYTEGAYLSWLDLGVWASLDPTLPSL